MLPIEHVPLKFFSGARRITDDTPRSLQSILNEIITEMNQVGWQLVEAGQERIIRSTFAHVVTYVEIESTGVMTIEDGGVLVLV